VTPDSWGATFASTAFELTIPKSAAGELLGIFLPSSGVVLKGKLLFRVDDAGFHFDGGVGLNAKWPDTVRLPGIVIHSLSTGVAVSGSSFPVSATGTIVVSLGPMTVTIEGFGITQPLRIDDRRKWEPGHSRPAGAEASPAQPASASRSTPASSRVAASCASPTPRSRARSSSPSLSAQWSSRSRRSASSSRSTASSHSSSSCRCSSRRPSRSFSRLTLNAVGGCLRINRTVDTTGLRGPGAGRPHQRRADPHDLIARADLVLSAVATVFPAKLTQYLAAPILELGWGRPVSLVTMTAGVVFTFPNPVAIVIIGEFRIAVSSPRRRSSTYRRTSPAIIDTTTGDVSFDASLARSRIGTFDVTGDIALRGGSESFVFTAGGFNPLFTPPPDLTTLRRLAISISPSPVLKIHADSYFALTASSLQFGAAMYVEATLGPLGATGHISLDTLIHTEPKVHFTATISSDFQLTVGGEELASMSVDLLLEGQGHWHARAHASISLFFFSISGTLDIEWGTDAPIELGPPVDVAQAVRDALAADATWTHVCPPRTPARCSYVRESKLCIRWVFCA